jgi:hypothetical protein
LSFTRQFQFRRRRGTGSFDKAVKRDELAFIDDEKHPRDSTMLKVGSDLPQTQSHGAAKRHPYRKAKLHPLKVIPDKKAVASSHLL